MADIPARLHLPSPGTSLLDFPADVVRLLPQFFTAVEWAEGPSLTCRTLNSMQLPSLTLDLNTMVLVTRGIIHDMMFPAYGSPMPRWQIEREALERKRMEAKTWAEKRGVQVKLHLQDMKYEYIFEALQAERARELAPGS
ncbi:g10007 [Coccomyxa viridis]|uniref:G10007 protein n=1 Tax=Coccomyxa viridis TaxID=1274662 RepID=A0ABP1G4G0_9CHLO